MPDLPFQMQKQEQTNWCWAAVSASVAIFNHDPAWRQCTVVNTVLNAILTGADCCTDGSSPSCNIPFDLRASLLRINHLAQAFAGPLPFANVQAQIQSGRPIGCRILSPGPVAHFIAIIGCAQTAAGPFVTVADPDTVAPETTTLSYADLLTRYIPNSRWDQTYLTR